MSLSTDKPNAEQERWRELLRSQGSILSGNRGNKIEIHHPIGRTAQAKTLEHGSFNIGHWFVVSLSDQEHHWLGNDLGQFRQAMKDAGLGGLYPKCWNVTPMSRIEMEVSLWLMQLTRLISEGWRHDITVPGHVIEAIVRYTK